MFGLCFWKLFSKTKIRLCFLNHFSKTFSSVTQLQDQSAYVLGPSVVRPIVDQGAEPSFNRALAADDESFGTI